MADRRYHVAFNSFSSPEPTILLACGRNRELWEQPFWNNKGNNRILSIRFNHSGLTQPSSMSHARNGCSQSSQFLPQARRIVGSEDENAFNFEGRYIEMCMRPFSTPELFSFAYDGQREELLRARSRKRRVWGREWHASSSFEYAHWGYKSIFKKSFQNGYGVVIGTIGTLRKTRRRRQRERHQTKGLMSKTMAVHVCYNSLYISLPSSAKQQREMTKFCVVWRTWTTTG